MKPETRDESAGQSTVSVTRPPSSTNAARPANWRRKLSRRPVALRVVVACRLAGWEADFAGGGSLWSGYSRIAGDD